MSGLRDRAVPHYEVDIENTPLALAAARAVLEKHAEDLVILDVRRLSTVTDFFVTATAGSPRQLAAIAEHTEETLRRIGHRVRHIEGLPAPAEGFAWVLIDAGDLVVHLFNPPARSFYQLERLWGDAPRLPLDPKQLLSALP